MDQKFLWAQMQFNRRVLEQGTLHAGRNYRPEDLEQILFFNKIFHSNCDELFQKYDLPPEVMRLYIECMKSYVRNVHLVLEELQERHGIHLLEEDTFEQRWSALLRIRPYLTTEFHNVRNRMSFPFIENQLYYVCRCDYHDQLAISTMDMKTSVYESPITCNYSNQLAFWKTDSSIGNAIKHMFHDDQILVLSVIRSKEAPHHIRKVEYFGDPDFMQEIKHIFGYETIFIRNPLLYEKDIEQMLKRIKTMEECNSAHASQHLSLIDLKLLTKRDSLLEYPQDSFESYLQFLASAACSEDVCEIDLTLYRIGENPAIFYILRNAVKRGIRVHVNLELLASGESINESWKQEMQQAGIHVTTYQRGIWKVHSKLTLVKFHSGLFLAQIGTGNYHTETTSQYTDLSLTTSDPVICQQVEGLFKLFDGGEAYPFNEEFLVTQFNCRDVLESLILEEGKKREDGYICFKCNAMDDKRIQEKLDFAAASGCKIDLIVRGVCTWIPKELNRNVTIRSFIWDKLEHSRVYSFGKNNPVVYMGSLDLVTKKIEQRIETLVKIKDPEISIKLCSYLNRYITNRDRNAWKMREDGEYVKEGENA